MSYSVTGEFTVKEARNRGTMPNPHGGELTKWYCDLLDSDGQPVKNSAGEVKDVYWQRKPENEVKAGDVVYGTISENDYGLRFKLQQRPDGGSSDYGSGSSGGNNFKGGGKSPADQAAIQRQVALKILAPRINQEGLSDSVKSLVEEIEDFISASVVGNTAPPASQEVTGPEANPGLGRSQTPDDSHQHLSMLIENEGYDALASPLLANYILEEVEAAKRGELVVAVNHAGRRPKALAWAEGKYELAHGPLPNSTPAEDIPF